MSQERRSPPGATQVPPGAMQEPPGATQEPPGATQSRQQEQLIPINSLITLRMPLYIHFPMLRISEFGGWVPKRVIL